MCRSCTGKRWISGLVRRWSIFQNKLQIVSVTAVRFNNLTNALQHRIAMISHISNATDSCCNNMFNFHVMTLQCSCMLLIIV